MDGGHCPCCSGVCPACGGGVFSHKDENINMCELCGHEWEAHATGESMP